MFEIPRLYLSACSNSVQYVDFAHSYMSILLYHHKQLVECSEEVEQIEIKVTIKKRRGLTKSKEESEEDFPLLQPPAPARQLKLSEFQSG